MMQAAPGDDEINQTLLRGVQGGGFLEKNPPGRRRQKSNFMAGRKSPGLKKEKKRGQAGKTLRVA